MKRLNFKALSYGRMKNDCDEFIVIWYNGINFDFAKSSLLASRSAIVQVQMEDLAMFDGKVLNPREIPVSFWKAWLDCADFDFVYEINTMDGALAEAAARKEISFYCSIFINKLYTGICNLLSQIAESGGRPLSFVDGEPHCFDMVRPKQQCSTKVVEELHIENYKKIWSTKPGPMECNSSVVSKCKKVLEVHLDEENCDAENSAIMSEEENSTPNVKKGAQRVAKKGKRQISHPNLPAKKKTRGSSVENEKPEQAGKVTKSQELRTHKNVPPLPF